MTSGRYRPQHAAPITATFSTVIVIGAMLIGAALVILLTHMTDPAGPHATRRRPPPTHIVLIRSEP